MALDLVFCYTTLRLHIFFTSIVFLNVEISALFPFILVSEEGRHWALYFFSNSQFSHNLLNNLTSPTGLECCLHKILCLWVWPPSWILFHSWIPCPFLLQKKMGLYWLLGFNICWGHLFSPPLPPQTLFSFLWIPVSFYNIPSLPRYYFIEMTPFMG